MPYKEIKRKKKGGKTVVTLRYFAHKGRPPKTKTVTIHGRKYSMTFKQAKEELGTSVAKQIFGRK